MLDYLIIGAQRAGTSSLYHYLTRHPRIPAAREKELHFFDIYFAEGIDWYRSNLPIDTAKRVKGLVGEASPYYLFHPLAPARVQQLCPDVKLIVLLRDPVARAWSHYHHERRLGVECLGFEKALKREDKRLAGEEERMRAEPTYFSFSHQHFSYAARGLYADQLRRWFSFFPREQFLIERSEDMFVNPGGTYGRVLEFVGAEPFECGRFEVQLAGDYNAEVPDKAARMLVDLYEQPAEDLVGLIGQRFRWTRQAPTVVPWWRRHL